MTTLVKRVGACLVFLVFLSTISTGCKPSTARGSALGTDWNSTFDAFVQKTLKDYGVPGAAVVIVENDKVTFAKGYGVRTLGQPDLVDENTRFQIASVTKWFAAGTAGVLVDDGKIVWDTPVVQYIPEFAMMDTYAGTNASCRDFLSHRSGLKAYDGDLLPRLGYTNAEMLFRVRYLQPVSSFRGKNKYSNVAFFIVGQVIERLEGATWPAVTDQRLIKPLGMTRSSAYGSEINKDENRAGAHMVVNGQLTVIPYEVDDMPPAGSVISTARDMGQWLRLLLGDGNVDGMQVLTPGTIKEILKPAFATPGSGMMSDPGAGNALGCNGYHYLKYWVVEKNGALNGMRALVTIIPEKKAGIAIMCNRHLTVFPEAVSAQFLESLLGQAPFDLQNKIHESQKAWDSAGARPTPPPNPLPVPRPMSEYAGTYQSQLYGQLTISLVGSNLIGAAGPANYPAIFTHFTGDTFLLLYPDPDDAYAIVTFTTGAGGTVNGLNSDTYGIYVK